MKGKEAFETSPLIQVWIVHHLLIIGEAVRAIDPAPRQRYPSVPWRQIAGMRNTLGNCQGVGQTSWSAGSRSLRLRAPAGVETPGRKPA